jgi:hypothetical protein
MHAGVQDADADVEDADAGIRHVACCGYCGGASVHGGERRMNVQEAYRHAVYFAPRPEHPLWAAGCSWLGRDPTRPDDMRPPPRPQVGEPWRYGFHGTLKPPLRLAAPQDEWLQAVAALAARTQRFQMPALHIDWLGDFIALLPVHPLGGEHPLERLADACTLELDAFRLRSEPEPLPRRQAFELSERQRAHLQRYGYPFVLDDWRFHMTLSDGLSALDAQEQAALKVEARDHFAAALQVPLVCDSLCVYVEPVQGAPFVLSHRFDFAPEKASP